MSNSPLVSICIPNYNNEEFIGEAIWSALNQTYNHIEVIVVDNCSTDKSWEIISEIQHSKIRIYRNPENVGMVGNFRTVLSYAKGDFITFLCSDDYLFENSIQENIYLLKKFPSANFVFGNIEYCGERKGRSDLNFSEFIEKGRWTKYSLSIGKNLSFITGTIFRKKSLIKIKGSAIEDLTFFDWLLWLKLGLGSSTFNSNLVGVHRYHSSNQTKILTPDVTKNYQHLVTVLNEFSKKYPEQIGIAKAKDKLSYRFAQLILHNDSLKSSVIFAKEYSRYFIIIIIKLAIIYLYTQIINKIRTEL